MIKYDTTVEANTSHALMLDLVGGGHDVLDVGCATGYLAAALRGMGNRVSGVELDPDSAAQAGPHLVDLLVADIESVDLVAHFGPASFDVVVFGDVLEHLRNPHDVLRRAIPLLRQGGSVVVSIPNVAHGSVRLSLLQGEWRYRSLGLLDDTHIHFFTRTGVDELLRAAGLVVVDRRRTTAPPLGTEVTVDAAHLPDGALAWVEADDDAWTYQFVYRAVRDDADGLCAALTRQMAEQANDAASLAADLEAERGRRRVAEAELAALRSTLTLRATAGARRLYGRLRGRRR